MIDPQANSPTEHRPVRIVQLVFSLEPGGMENGVVNLANALDPAVFETEILCLERVGVFAERLRAGVRVACLEKSPGLSPGAVAKLAARWRRSPPDLLHTHNLGPLLYGVLGRAGAMRRMPILHGEHGVLRPEDLAPRRLFMRRALYRRCARVHTVSAALKEHLTGLGFPGKEMVALLNGVDCERFRPAPEKAAAKEALGLPAGAFVVGMVGRMVASKQHLLLLDGFAEAASVSAEAWLLLLGDGGDSREQVLAAIEAHPFRERIRWVGHQQDPTAFYHAMDLLAMPSSVEGLSNVLLEAMACGVPCLAHPACGASEVLRDGENGLLLPMETPAQFAGALRGILSEPTRAETLGRAARRAAEESFSLDGMVARYSELYSELAG